jgi:hypothetical protein
MEGVDLPLAFKRVLVGRRQPGGDQNAAAGPIILTDQVLIGSDVRFFDRELRIAAVSSSDSFPKRDKR